MPFYKISKLFLLFFLLSCTAVSQDFPGKNYTAAGDLPNNAVRALLIDSNNILWIGTENGVVKKENDVFKYFFEEDGLALNSCWAIAEDKNKNLWFGSYGEGVSIYDGFKFKVLSEEDGLAHNQITKLYASGNHMYVGTSDGLSVVNINTLEVLSLKTPAGEELFRVVDFFETGGQIYVVSYRSGVFRIEGEGKETALVKVNDQRFLYSAFVDNDSIYSSNKEFFTKSSLEDYIDKKDELPQKKYGKSIIWDYVKTKDNKIFAAAWGIYDADGGIYELIDNRLVSRASEFNIPGNEVISLAYDPKFEKLYVGTKDAGLFEVALNPQIKIHEIRGKNVLGFANTGTTSAILLNDGILLNRGGKEQLIPLARLKKWQENYVSTTKLPLPQHRDDFYELDYSTKASDIGFYDIKVSGNRYWVNTNIGLFAINDSAELYQYLPLHSEEINFTPAGELLETNPYGGVRVYSDLDRFEYTHFDQKAPHTPTMVVSSLQRGTKTYFLSIFSGLFVWENNGFRSYRHNDIWQEKKLKHITTLGRDLAISNEFGDVFIVNDEDSFIILEKIPRAKIRGNSISFLREYEGTLIVGTEKGISLYKDGRSIFLDKEQGLEQPVLSASVAQNILAVGSHNGYYEIDLDAVIEPRELIDKIELKEIFINNKEYAPGPIYGKDRVELAHNQNTVLLRYSTNAHPYPNKLQYRYRLNPGEDWSLPSSKPEIFLPSLPVNDYEVEVKVLDESTGLSYTRPLLQLAVLPPFWKTWWFVFGVTGVMIAVVYSFYQIQLRQARRFEAQKGLLQKRFEETKMEALLAQMNPHFIFNAMNSIQYYIMDSDIDNASSFLGDFAKLIRLNLDHCTKPTISLIEEIEYLQLYTRVENTRFNNRIQVVFEVAPSIDVNEVEIPTMLLQTFVENVFVHAFPGSITNPTLKISFLMPAEGILHCRIDDNGIGSTGTSKKDLHQSKGITLVKERLTLLGYNVDEAVQITSEKDKGTSVLLKLKV